MFAALWVDIGAEAKSSCRYAQSSPGKLRTLHKAQTSSKNVPLTIPGVKHVSDEVVYEGDLRFGYAARVPVKHRHHHREPLSLLLIRLQEGGEERQHGDVTAEKPRLP